ncbi:hypothetical protein SCO02_06200 [Staphylococcus ureilyticus]|uniref:Uncharacterized protein n=1 Tax=Staphylococcus ureilyticus TaxID=94138 RepID=A0AB34AFY1_STAUR|nr:hypothetical protein [Staphylococcus ureilyticus]GEQ02179.1 hypothetical protein SCO02_06200 [Staphylococcus ureilyticus]
MALYHDILPLSIVTLYVKVYLTDTEKASEFSNILRLVIYDNIRNSDIFSLVTYIINETNYTNHCAMSVQAIRHFYLYEASHMI